MLVLMVTSILDGGYTNSSILHFWRFITNPAQFFERWSKSFGGWTLHRRVSQERRFPSGERGASRLIAKNERCLKN
jgi:hypothetical protein